MTTTAATTDIATRPLRRITSVTPGYDCARHPCGKGNCGKTSGGNHGIHCDEWWYALTDGQIALSFTVWSGIFPPSVPSDVSIRLSFGRDKVAQGVNIASHIGFPIDRESVRIPLSPGVSACEYLDPGLNCHDGHGSVLKAEAFFNKYGTDSYEQPESFWQALEVEWRQRAERALAERTDTKWVRCPRCNGEGTTTKPASTLTDSTIGEIIDHGLARGDADCPEGLGIYQQGRWAEDRLLLKRLAWQCEEQCAEVNSFYFPSVPPTTTLTASDLDQLESEIQAATGDVSKWCWWTSNSHMRLSSDSGGNCVDGDVLSATVARDGVPVLVVSEANAKAITSLAHTAKELIRIARILVKK